jgi:hypothetical protein
MVIFGYNSEVRVGDTVYHVQSELCGGELLDTQVFVGGRCLAKRASRLQPDADPAAVQEWLRRQHRFVLDCLRAGEFELISTNRTGV